MDSARLLFCGLLISIVFHTQAMKGNSELERIPPALGDKREDKRHGTDPAKVRRDAVDRLLDSLEDAIARWRELEATYAEYLADNRTFSGFIVFLDSDTGEDDCYNTGRMLDAIDALISFGVSRRKNEVAAVARNHHFLNTFQRWLGFFTTTKHGVANKKAKLVRLLD